MKKRTQVRKWRSKLLARRNGQDVHLTSCIIYSEEKPDTKYKKKKKNTQTQYKHWETDKLTHTNKLIAPTLTQPNPSIASRIQLKKKKNLWTAMTKAPGENFNHTRQLPKGRKWPSRMLTLHPCVSAVRTCWRGGRRTQGSKASGMQVKWRLREGK